VASYLILGAGKFGRLAVQRLAARDPAARFVVVDRSREALARVPGNEARVIKIQAEVSAFLREEMPCYASFDWVIPAVPVHVALLSLLGNPKAGGWECLKVPEELEKLAPVAIRGSQGELYLSRARHLCPDDCPEPEDVCPISGESLSPALYEVLAALSLPGYKVWVIISRPLAPGVGGYPPGELLKLPDVLQETPCHLLIATACRCHGVVHALGRREGGLK